MGRRGALPHRTVRPAATLPGTARDLYDADASPAFRGTGAVESDAADRFARLRRRLTPAPPDQVSKRPLRKRIAASACLAPSAGTLTPPRRAGWRGPPSGGVHALPRMGARGPIEVVGVAAAAVATLHAVGMEAVAEGLVAGQVVLEFLRVLVDLQDRRGASRHQAGEVRHACLVHHGPEEELDVGVGQLVAEVELADVELGGKDLEVAGEALLAELAVEA